MFLISRHYLGILNDIKASLAVWRGVGGDSTMAISTWKKKKNENETDNPGSNAM